jgi:hypothetical protein
VNEDDRLRAEAALQSAELFLTEVKRRLAIGTEEALVNAERMLESARMALEFAEGWIRVLRGEESGVNVGRDEDSEG